MTMDTASIKTISMVGWNAAILPTNCFLMMYDIPENYTFFSIVHLCAFIKMYVSFLPSISADIKTAPTLQLTSRERER